MMSGIFCGQRKRTRHVIIKTIQVFSKGMCLVAEDCVHITCKRKSRVTFYVENGHPITISNENNSVVVSLK